MCDDRLGKLLVLRTGQGAVYAVGRCISYTDAPTISIETVDGKNIHWRADMVTVIGDEDVAEYVVPIAKEGYLKPSEPAIKGRITGGPIWP